jgi:hypothetical protein
MTSTVDAFERILQFGCFWPEVGQATDLIKQLSAAA